MSHILGIKFRDHGQLYYFDSGPFVVGVGDSVLVQTEQGLGMGKVALVRDTPPEGEEQPEIKPIFRLPTTEDVDIQRENDLLAREAHTYCRKCIESRNLEMKLVDVEVLHDRGKIVFYFTAPGRIDFRELVKDLVKAYHTRIELRQIGVRHETQMLGAIGNCGQMCCCRRFMRKFAPVTIKMAKEQNLFLNPTKISGICGRLLCCLSFEQENYEQFQKKCPRVGKKFSTSFGLVKVLRTNLFRETISVLDETGEEHELTVEEWNAALANPASAESRSQERQDAAGPEAGRTPPRRAPEGQQNQPPRGERRDRDRERPRAAGQGQSGDAPPRESREGQGRSRRGRRPSRKGPRPAGQQPQQSQEQQAQAPRPKNPRHAPRPEARQGGKNPSRPPESGS
ncbi:PSP1 domain protein [Solidesulfovibrio fructosivorans JJ]]|uniref:PSP1 domain protein n=1 Tax=Solidesulfovibrio fructosivorans JJ] TaxID=596151 RepID=E1K0C1_SOLFR|nr:stage 0 sporulation family protein [Solidesulfovibrio fructosivorans]EFL49952.1 PSP1 domain protein [Solidesulfovibrio fructosivorans JJ]]